MPKYTRVARVEITLFYGGLEATEQQATKWVQEVLEHCEFPETVIRFIEWEPEETLELLP